MHSRSLFLHSTGNRAQILTECEQNAILEGSFIQRVISTNSFVVKGRPARATPTPYFSIWSNRKPPDRLCQPSQPFQLGAGVIYEQSMGASLVYDVLGLF